MMQPPLFGEQVGAWPLPTPCPIREGCPPYHCERGGCDGERAICTAAQLAAGRWMPESHWNLLCNYTRRRYEKIVRERRIDAWAVALPALRRKCYGERNDALERMGV